MTPQKFNWTVEVWFALDCFEDQKCLHCAKLITPWKDFLFLSAWQVLLNSLPLLSSLRWICMFLFSNTDAVMKSDLELIGKIHLSCLCKTLKRVIDSLGYLRRSVWTNNVVNKCFRVKKSWIIYVRVTSEWFTGHCDFIFLMFIFISFKDLH